MLRYYEEEACAFPKAHNTWLEPWQAVCLAEWMRGQLGEPRIQYILPRRECDFDRANKATRTIEFFPPRVTVAAVLHELAHMYTMTHDVTHATIVCLLHAILRSKR